MLTASKGRFGFINKKAELPEEIKREDRGMMLVARSGQERRIKLRISDIKEESIIIDSKSRFWLRQDLNF